MMLKKKENGRGKNVPMALRDMRETDKQTKRQDWVGWGGGGGGGEKEGGSDMEQALKK